MNRLNRPTLDEIRRWPATCSIEDAARALGIGRSSAYVLVRRGLFPVETLPVGIRRRVTLTDSLIKQLEAKGSADPNGIRR
jgi:hypothetical protein